MTNAKIKVFTLLGAEGVVHDGSRVPGGGASSGARPVELVPGKVHPGAKAGLERAVVDDRGWGGGGRSGRDSDGGQNVTPRVRVHDVVDGHVA